MAADQDIEPGLQAIRNEYARRRTAAPSSTRGGRAMFESRLAHYQRALRATGILPLGGRMILDLGCSNGKWLKLCTERWGADPERCYGLDLLPDQIRLWREMNPDSKITLACRPAHEPEFDDQSFDVVHTSMMFSSIVDAQLRDRTAASMWRVLKPGGHVFWYDFWINPFNRRTVPMRVKGVKGLFPEGKVTYRKTITLAPPLVRSLKWASDGLLLALQKLRVFNTHHLIVVAKKAE